MKNLAIFFVFGMIAMLGMRTIEWVVPAPDKKVHLVVCIANDYDKMDDCEFIDSLSMNNPAPVEPPHRF